MQLLRSTSEINRKEREKRRWKEERKNVWKQWDLEVKNLIVRLVSMVDSERHYDNISLKFKQFSLSYLRERFHIFIQPAAVATVRNDPQSCMPIG